MDTNAGHNVATFKQKELSGWDAKASAYNDYAGKITAQLVRPLLDAARVKTKTRLLDIACGPGYVAGAASERGTNAVGVDFAPSMAVEARKNFPRAEFFEGDAESLRFKDDSFDAVACAFGLAHLPDPDEAILEAFRVLRTEGRYAFSWWCSPEKHEFFALVFDALKAHGNLEVVLPPAPPMFRLSDPQECRRELSRAGFGEVEVREHSLVYELESPQQALDLIYKKLGSHRHGARITDEEGSGAYSRGHPKVRTCTQAQGRLSDWLARNHRCRNEALIIVPP